MIEQIKKMLKELALLSGMITKDRDTSVLSFLNVKSQARKQIEFFHQMLLHEYVLYKSYKNELLALKFTIETVIAMSAADDT